MSGESSSETENPYSRMPVTKPLHATMPVQNGARLSWDPWISKSGSAKTCSSRGTLAVHVRVSRSWPAFTHALIPLVDHPVISQPASLMSCTQACVRAQARAHTHTHINVGRSPPGHYRAQTRASCACAYCACSPSIQKVAQHTGSRIVNSRRTPPPPQPRNFSSNTRF